MNAYVGDGSELWGCGKQSCSWRILLISSSFLFMGKSLVTVFMDERSFRRSDVPFAVVLELCGVISLAERLEDVYVVIGDVS
jgi:hypothetical protein